MCSDFNTNISDESGIEKFEGEFEKEESGVTIAVNASINHIKNLDALAIYSYLLTKHSDWRLNAKQLASHFCCNKDKIYKALRYLIMEGFLAKRTIKTQGRFVRTYYFLHLHRVYKNSNDGSEPRSSPRLEKPEVEKPEQQIQDTYKTKNIQNKEKEIKETPLISPQGESVCGVLLEDEKKPTISNAPESCSSGKTAFTPELFAAFWTIYPVKQAKKICEKYWVKHKLDRIAGEIMERLKIQIVQDKNFLGGYVRNPLKYLKEEGWLDPVVSPRDDKNRNQSPSSSQRIWAR